MNKLFLSWSGLLKRLSYFDVKGEVIYGIPRGGMIISAFIQNATVTCYPEQATLFIDDIIDSGKTKEKYQKKYPGIPFVALFDKLTNEEDKKIDWVVFPYETDKETDYEDLIVRILEHNSKEVNEKNINILKDKIEECFNV